VNVYKPSREKTAARFRAEHIDDSMTDQPNVAVTK
jgi:hypothetical protein